MKFWKKLTALLSVSVLTASLVASNFSVSNKVNTDAASSTNNDDWLHVCGNQIHDANCKKVWLTGVNWFGFNCTENILHGWWASVDVGEMVGGIADKGFNLIRVPISVELLVSWMNGAPLKAAGVTAYPSVNDDLIDIKTDSMALFDYFMGLCKKYGLKVMVDIHSAESDNSGHDKNLWYYGKFTSKDWQDSLVWLAGKYKNDDTLIAYDLKNEPHGKAAEAKAGTGAKWDGSTDLNNWKYAAETCGKAILAVNPNALIMIEGVETTPVAGHTYAEDPIGYPVITNYYGAWWGGNLREVKNHPITLKNPSTGKSQLVYSPHEYGPSVYQQSWFNKNFTLQTLHDDYMHDTWDYLLPDYPLLIGEWGGHMDGGDNQKWMTIMRDYMIENMVHHTFWCYNPNSGDTGGLIGNDWKTWDMKKYGLVEPALWKSGSKYIGLDHQIPLGKNGMTLTDYYGGTIPTEPKTEATTATTTTTAVTTTVTTTTTTTVTAPITEATPPTTTSTTPPAVIYGDVNGDKSVTIDDVVMLRLYLLNTVKYPLTEEQQAAARVIVGQSSIQGNCAVTIQDYVVEKIKTLPYASN